MDLSYKSVTKYIFEQGEAVERFSASSSHLCHGVELSLKGVLLICTLLGSNGQLKMGLTVQTPDGFVMLISFDKGKTVVHGHAWLPLPGWKVCAHVWDTSLRAVGCVSVSLALSLFPIAKCRTPDVYPALALMCLVPAFCVYTFGQV